MNARKLFGLGAATLVVPLAAQVLANNVTDRQGDRVNRDNSFNLPASLQKPAREGQRNIPSPWIRRTWAPDIPIATIPSVISILSGPTRTVLAQRGLLRGQAQPAQAPQPYGPASVAFDNEGNVDTVYFGDDVRIGPEDTETVAIDGAAVHEALERAGRRPELEKFFQEGVFGVRGAILRRLGVTG